MMGSNANPSPKVDLLIVFIKNDSTLLVGQFRDKNELDDTMVNGAFNDNFSDKLKET